MSRALALVNSSDASRNEEHAGAATQLLETKLYVPRSRSDLVPRPRLIDAIRQGAAQKLTIVVAPAGFGKTTLVAGCFADMSAAKTVETVVRLTRFRGRLTRPNFGAEVVHEIQQEGGISRTA